jgi:hypothetical protein
MRKYVLVGVITLGFGTSALGSGCMTEIKVPIKFERGAACWSYSGVGTTFYGNFAAQQHITAQAIGIGYGDEITTMHLTVGAYSRNAIINDSGRRVDYSANADDNGNFDSYTGLPGSYSFSISPCSAWGNPVMIIICTGNKR